MTPAGPPLRDIHLPPAPDWWPPAPGWWVLAVLVLVALTLASMILWRRWRAYRLRRRLCELFEAQMREGHDAVDRLALASTLLRRAARRPSPAAASLAGEAWLGYLDGEHPDQPFSQGAGRILLDGPFRPRLSEVEVDAALALARERFIELGGQRAA